MFHVDPFLLKSNNCREIALHFHTTRETAGIIFIYRKSAYTLYNKRTVQVAVSATVVGSCSLVYLPMCKYSTIGETKKMMLLQIIAKKKIF